jgi:hypothetical protein
MKKKKKTATPPRKAIVQKSILETLHYIQADTQLSPSDKRYYSPPPSPLSQFDEGCGCRYSRYSDKMGTVGDSRKSLAMNMLELKTAVRSYLKFHPLLNLPARLHTDSRTKEVYDFNESCYSHGIDTIKWILRLDELDGPLPIIGIN